MVAVGIHTFAGGFSHGVQQVCPVLCQLETHNFGLESARGCFDIDCINTSDATEWPDVKADWCFGNPRCTGFSCITSGYSDDVHGPWAKQTKDIHDLCHYGIKQNYQVIVWESVQQAMTTGRALLDYLRDELFVPNDYRIAHLQLNAASFGNVQRRRRYFFVAYKKDRNFNIVPPNINKYHPATYDAIWHRVNRDTHPFKLHSKATSYTEDSYLDLTQDEWTVVPHIGNGWNLNLFAKYRPDLLPDKLRFSWETRTSDMPFSMHCICRVQWFCAFPTMHSSASRFLHPRHHRPVTLGELSDVMGWPCIPKGPNPVPQLAKGVVPQIGTWLAEQVRLYLADHWKQDDWESSYNAESGEWVGRETHGESEKYFNLTTYLGEHRHDDRELAIPYGHIEHRHPVDPSFGDDLKRRARRSESEW